MLYPVTPLHPDFGSEFYPGTPLDSVVGITTGARSGPLDFSFVYTGDLQVLNLSLTSWCLRMANTWHPDCESPSNWCAQWAGVLLTSHVSPSVSVLSNCMLPLWCRFSRVFLSVQVSALATLPPQPHCGATSQKPALPTTSTLPSLPLLQGAP